MVPQITSWGEWIGGLWPSHEMWLREWVTTWAAIGWYAKHDCMLAREFRACMKCGGLSYLLTEVVQKPGWCVFCRVASFRP